MGAALYIRTCFCQVELLFMICNKRFCASSIRRIGGRTSHLTPINFAFVCFCTISANLVRSALSPTNAITKSGLTIGSLDAAKATESAWHDPCAIKPCLRSQVPKSNHSWIGERTKTVNICLL